MNAFYEENIRSDSITFRHAKGPSLAVGKEFHSYHEIILFLAGSAELVTESLHIDLVPNTLIILPKETYHQVIIKGDTENYHRCVLNFEDIEDFAELFDRALGEIQVITPGRNILFLFETLKEHAKSQDICSGIILKSVLALLLADVSSKEGIQVYKNTQSILVQRCIGYINAHIHKKITIEKIAADCNISPSSLSHIFKKEMNISLIQFIIKKRLINAYHKIASGQSATSAAMECGFNDYSGFYKQYKKMFGFSPSQKSNKANAAISFDD